MKYLSIIIIAFYFFSSKLQAEYQWNDKYQYYFEEVVVSPVKAKRLEDEKFFKALRDLSPLDKGQFLNNERDLHLKMYWDNYLKTRKAQIQSQFSLEEMDALVSFLMTDTGKKHVKVLGQNANLESLSLRYRQAFVKRMLSHLKIR